MQGVVGPLVSLPCVDNWGRWKADAEERRAGIISKLFYLHVWQLRVALGWDLWGASAAYSHVPFPCGPLAYSQNGDWVPRASIPNRGWKPGSILSSRPGTGGVASADYTGQTITEPIQGEGTQNRAPYLLEGMP